MGSDKLDSQSTLEGSYDLFQVKSFGENLAVNLGMIFVTITALILSMLLLPHLLVGVTWNGG